MLTQKRLKELLTYNVNTGVFVWNERRGGSALKGSVAGALSQGYRNIQVDKKTFQAHRLAWLYVHGKFPDKDLDHINLKRDDNRISNLREVNDSENKQNQRKYSTNTSGYKGVSWSKSRNKWSAGICVNYKTISLGYFDKIEDAAKAYEDAANKFHKFNLIAKKEIT